MTPKPDFIDNRNENTLAKALQEHLSWVDETYANPISLSVATGYFNPEGFCLLSDPLEKLSGIRLLLGAEPIASHSAPTRKPGDPRGDAYEKRLIENALQSLESSLARDRNMLGFSPDTTKDLQYLIDFLNSDKIEVKRYEKRFLHGKAYVFGDKEGVIVGSSNMTRAGLVSNLELNLGRYDPNPVQKVSDWFNDLWDEAEDFDLASIYEVRFQPYDPFLIYIRVLWELYGEELTRLQGEAPGIPLTTFQNDGIKRTKYILDKFNGALIADAVGLGKSFIAGEIMRETVAENRQRVLLISPAALRDGTWNRFQSRYNFYFENISYQQLMNDRQLGGDSPILKADIMDYSLVVIDEAQAFRNPATERAQALRRLLGGTPPKKLLMLSATPVNNSLWDLYYLISFFVNHDAVFADKGISSLRERFKDAVSHDPYDLEPDLLFDILDGIAVRRTRQFILNWYPNEQIKLPDGETITVTFPEPKVIRVNYKLDAVLPTFFDEFEEALAPEEGDPKLTMARYIPSDPKYSKRGQPEQYEMALIGLLRSGLLKRFESSSFAFANTAETMANSHDHFLDILAKGYIATPEIIKLWGNLEDEETIEWSEIDNDEAMNELLSDAGMESATGYDIDALERDVKQDRDLLRRLSAEARKVEQEDDPKLIALVDELAAIVEAAEKDGITNEEIVNNRKVLIFSYFADTVDWIEGYLRKQVGEDPRLSCYKDRIASITSEQSRHGISREDAIWGFAPVSTEAPSGSNEDRFDILIATDVLAEGQNLQQARHIINYDLPWNPMRLVQRNGRINRLASRHRYVYNRCIFPDKKLDELLALEERIRQKLAQAAASIGLESEVIPEGATSEQVFANTVFEIGKIRDENPELLVTGGEEPGAHSGEEYRQLLRKGLELYGRTYVKNLPWAIGSGLISGYETGHFFCANVGDRTFLRFVPLNGEELTKDTLGCLQLIDCEQDTPRELSDVMKDSVYDAWEKAKEDIYLEWMNATDPRNLQPEIRKLFRDDIPEYLRKYPPKEMSEEDYKRLLDTIQAPRGMRIENQFREIFKDEQFSPQEKTDQIVNLVKDLGLQPFQPPEPLPVIDEDEIRLICWMGVCKENE